MRNKKHRNNRKKFCGEKRSYLTREDACHDMGLLAETTGTTGLSVYKCGKHFHVGHTPYKIQRRFGLES